MARRLNSLARRLVRSASRPSGDGGGACCKRFTRQQPPFVAPATINASRDTFAITSRGLSSAIDTCANGPAPGEECYQRAMEALRNASSAKQANEERLMKEQFDAMERQRNRTRQREQQRSQNQDNPRLARLRAQDEGKGEGKDRAAGVAVVRTIVKQSQKDRDVQIDKWDASMPSAAMNATPGDKEKISQQLYDEEHWQTVAAKQMEEAAFRYGHPLALVRLGNEALERAKDGSSSQDSVIDRERCQEWIEDSPLDLTSMLALGTTDGESCNRDVALRLYKEAGKRGSHEGWYNLGHLLWDGPATAKEEAMDAFHEAMKLGDADALYFVGVQYLSFEEGDEESKKLLAETYAHHGTDFLDALQSRDDILGIPFAHEIQQFGCKLLYLAAEESRHGPALHHLALLHYQHEDAEEYRHFLSQAAATGNPDALFLLGHSHYFGSDGYAQDFREALENFLAAGEHGNADALVSAGAMLHKGVIQNGITVVGRDQQKAFDLYQEAGELGSVEGWRNVVSCYASGEGVPKCLETAKHIADTMLKDDDST
ncbi:hypothetical protein ACHAXT_006297 [Thalassiosira profunda]